MRRPGTRSWLCLWLNVGRWPGYSTTACWKQSCPEISRNNGRKSGLCIRKLTNSCLKGWLQIGGSLPNSLGGPSKVSSVCLRWTWESSRCASVLMNPGSLDMPVELAFGFFCICDWRHCCNSVFFRLLAGIKWGNRQNEVAQLLLRECWVLLLLVL